MRITKIDIPKYEDNIDGLEHIKMDKLQNIVLIAGKNGSGKTRIINKIFTTINSKPKKTSIKSLISQRESSKKALTDYENQLAALQVRLTQTITEPQVSQITSQIKDFSNAITLTNLQITNQEEQLSWRKIETTEIAENYSYVRFVPKNLNLTDCNSFAKNIMISSATNVNKIGIESLPQGAFAKIQVIQDRWFSSTHPLSKVSEDEKAIAVADYEKLEQIIDIFLNTPLGRTIDDEATLFGFPMGKSNLSDGQKILIQFCLAIYSQETALIDLILILDEPENHLHPSVIVETIERIQKCVSNGQVWIATHSIPLLAHFDPSLIWFVDNNKISHAGKTPEKVLHSLLGSEEEVSKLQDFISLPSQFASSRYAFECLLEPSAVLTGSGDPQSYQIRTDLLSISSTGKLRILDYGSGKGRLISNIVDLDENNQEKLIEKIDFIAYDRFPNDKDYCENALIRAYGNCNNRYFNDFNTLFSTYDKESFDVVIMCNVLHEIDPKEWLKLFQSNGIITNCLKENGIILLVEDQQIPIGEKAYQKGFLVLDTPQLKELFKVTENDTDFSFTDKRGDGRLKAHKIPKRCLLKIDENSRLKAIESMATTARDKILEIRELEQNYQNGKLHGFWTQQFANAQLNLSELTSK